MSNHQKKIKNVEKNHKPKKSKKEQKIQNIDIKQIQQQLKKPLAINLTLPSNLGINKFLNKKTNLSSEEKDTKKKDLFQIIKIEENQKIENSHPNTPKNAQPPLQNSGNFQNLQFNLSLTRENIPYAGEYLEEIYLNLLLEEKNSIVKPKFGYMSNQTEINEQMRAILVDWIIEVHFQFNLKQETLFMTIWILDSYLSSYNIARKSLQLLGITCLLISCKSHEIYFPSHSKFIEVTDGAYKLEEMLKMENEILKNLNFNILSPNSNDFYNILSKFFNLNKKQYYLGKYFIESSLLDYKMIQYPQSVIAVACIYFVMKYFGLNGYQILYNKYVVNAPCPEDAIKDSAKEIYSLVENLSNSRLNNVKNKYGLTQFESVSEII